MEGADGESAAEALKQLDGDPDKTLADVRFMIGDYVACAILPPLPDGSVPAAPPPLSGPGRGPPGQYGGARTVSVEEATMVGLAEGAEEVEVDLMTGD